MVYTTDKFLNLIPIKCKYILISRKNTPVTPTVPLLLGNIPLQKVKYLGVLISQGMS